MKDITIGSIYSDEVIERTVSRLTAIGVTEKAEMEGIVKTCAEADMLDKTGTIRLEQVLTVLEADYKKGRMLNEEEVQQELLIGRTAKRPAIEDTLGSEKHDRAWRRRQAKRRN